MRILFNLKFKIRTFLYPTKYEGVAIIIRRTTAQRIVVHYNTFCISSTGTDTGIYTFLINACFILHTFTAHHTLGPAIWR